MNGHDARLFHSTTSLDSGEQALARIVVRQSVRGADRE